MKTIIDGLLYNTETAEELGTYESHLPRSDFGWYEETLYVTKKGSYFIAGRGNAMSIYAVPVGQNCWGSGSKIRPLPEEEARDWAERHMDVESYQDIFGAAEEA